MRRLLHGLMLAALSCGSAYATGDPTAYSPPGFLIFAEHRYDPSVQRMLAERSLKALPIRGGQLFFIVDQHDDRLIEEMQIRYIEELLSRQKFEPRPD